MIHALADVPPTQPIILRQLTTVSPVARIIDEYGQRMDATAARSTFTHERRLQSLSWWYWQAAGDIAREMRNQRRPGAIRSVTLRMGGQR